ncbi:MAG TPA: arginine deiminase family protein [Phnomibacter sp.]|nr:arginine deiminase family protein [Phnomibacter sp.]
MAKKPEAPSLMVTSEIGTLQRLLVHSPDSGLGKVVPSKAQDWLFEDIVHLDTIRRKEYDYYTKILLYFLDPEKVQGKLKEIDAAKSNRNFYKPNHPEFFRSDKVVELQWLLTDILEDREIKLKLVASVCALEGVAYCEQMRMMDIEAGELAKIFISGTSDENEMIFAPIPNFIFTRDIGIVINDHVLLNKPAKKARTREALLAKYIFFNHPLFADYQDKIIEIPEKHHHFLNPKEGDDKKVTLEGGDVMVVSKDHLLIGVSERTSWDAAHQATKMLLQKKVVKKVTVVKIPKKRDYMHIDTVFTQVRRNVWVMLGQFSKKAIKRLEADPIEKVLEDKTRKDEKITMIQFNIKNLEKPVYFDNLEDLLEDISRNDLRCKEKVKFIYSGNNKFPYDAREQWTDSCNLLALKEGVVVGYDRNDKTLEAFKKAGFKAVHVADLLNDFEAGTITPAEIENTFIQMPSAELSRARGGFHCMSMPLLRSELD